MGRYRMAMKKINVSMTEEMFRDLEEERKRRRLSSIPETVRVILGEYLSERNGR